MHGAASNLSSRRVFTQSKESAAVGSGTPRSLAPRSLLTPLNPRPTRQSFARLPVIFQVGPVHIIQPQSFPGYATRFRHRSKLTVVEYNGRANPGLLPGSHHLHPRVTLQLGTLEAVEAVLRSIGCTAKLKLPTPDLKLACVGILATRSSAYLLTHHPSNVVCLSTQARAVSFSTEI